MKSAENLVLIDKQKGITSFDVLRKLRRELGIKKLGHAGTLDPLATGLLIVGVQEGTKHLKELIGLSKVYEAEILIGLQTKTGDIDGEIVEEHEGVIVISEARVRKALDSMVGVLRIEAPIFSAMKRGGQPLYKAARAGKKVVAPLRDMEVIRAELVKIEQKERPHIHVVFEVGSGTYIRSLGEELGKRLGYPATLQNLRRTSIGEYRVKDARTLE